jgi:hypothetical protein
MYKGVRIMKNKLKLKEKLLSVGFSLGCYDSEIEKLSKKELDKILDNIEFGTTDIGVTIDNNKYIVEIYHVDNEVDLKIITPKEYAKTYGRIFSKK